MMGFVMKKLKIALETTRDELSIIGYVRKYKISYQEAKEYKRWCREIYYYKSYK